VSLRRLSKKKERSRCIAIKNRRRMKGPPSWKIWFRSVCWWGCGVTYEPEKNDSGTGTKGDSDQISAILGEPSSAAFGGVCKKWGKKEEDGKFESKKGERSLVAKKMRNFKDLEDSNGGKKTYHVTPYFLRIRG